MAADAPKAEQYAAAIVGMGLGLDGFAEIDVDPDELPFKLHEPRWMLPVFTGSSAQANTARTLENRGSVFGTEASSDLFAGGEGVPENVE